MKLFFIVLTFFRVAFVGDPQVGSEKELSYARKSIYSELQGRKDLDLVIVLGDIVNETIELIAPSEASLDSLKCPWLRIHGNHDGNVPVPDTVFVRKGVRFICMNNILTPSKGGLTRPQRQWLDSLVRTAPKREKIVICTHIPISWCEDKDTVALSFANNPNVLLVCGHVHYVDRHRAFGVEELMAGATCGSWWRGAKDGQGIPYALQNCGAPRGYFVADFRSCRKSWYQLAYKCVGREDLCSAHVLENGDVLVNVFGGSRDGVLEMKVSGKWVRAERANIVAPECAEVIESNSKASRSYRRSHPDEFIPMRKRPSQHVWLLKNTGLKEGDEVKLRYKDHAMKFKQKNSLILY